jgi:hypothetical protein
MAANPDLPDATGPRPVTVCPRDAPRHAGQVVRRQAFSATPPTVTGSLPAPLVSPQLGHPGNRVAAQGRVRAQVAAGRERGTRAEHRGSGRELMRISGARPCAGWTVQMHAHPDPVVQPGSPTL